jgi:hypothetical protein
LKAKLRKIEESRQVAGTVSDPSVFIRLLHAGSTPAKRLNAKRGLLTTKSVPHVVSTLFKTSLYAAMLSPGAFPQRYEDVKPRLALAPTRPELDMVWTASVLHQYADRLSRYVVRRDEFYASINGAHFSEAARILDETESEFGVSMWLMFSRLSLIQQATGISEQKEFINSVLQSESLNPLFGYLSFYFSYGLEENVSVAEINREIELLSEIGTNRDIVDYFRYHASPTGLSAVEDPYRCIALEENSPIIDRFETFVEMAQLITVRAEEPHLLTHLQDSVRLLRQIPDVRIGNLDCILQCNDPVPIDIDFLVACECYTLGDDEAAEEMCRYALSQTPAAAWWLELSARLGLMPSSAGTEPTSTSLVSKIVSGIRATDELHTDGGAAAALQKLAIAVRKQPAALCIAAIIDRTADITIADEFTENQALWALSSPLENPKHFPIIKKISSGALPRINAAAAKIAPLCATIHNATLFPTREAASHIFDMPVPQERRDQYQGHVLYNLGAFAEALKLYRHLEETSAEPKVYRAVRDIYLCLRKLSMADEAAEYMAGWVLRTPRAVALFPAREAADWLVEARGINRVALHRAIFLQACIDFGLAARDGDLSDAYEDVLDYYSCRVPSELIARSLEIDSRLLYVFLRGVCTISRMEDSIYFNSLDEIEDERIRILQFLIGVDSAARVYTDEIASIVKEQEVARLARQFDRSRIYVDELGIRRQIDPELRDLFVRYKQLLANPSLELKVEGIEQSLRRLLKRTDPDIQTLHIPSTERESVFESIYKLTRDNFALNPAHGFQTYLSTRILHGWLEGELRSSFVSRNLLFGEGKASAAAAVERVWREKLGALTEDEFGRVSRVLLRFSEKVTDAVAELRDTYMRVKTEKWPNGCFQFSATEDDKNRLRATITAETEFEEFMVRLMSYLWGLVDEGLYAAHELLKEFERRVDAHVNAAMSGLNSLPKSRVADLTDALVHGMTDFSADLQRVKAWFGRSGILPAEPFELDVAVGVSQTITNKCYPHSPVKCTLSGVSPTVNGAVLNALVDILSNCFHNVAQHSGCAGVERRVEVLASKVDGGLQISVRNMVSEATDLDQLRARVSERLAPDEDGSSAMNEGGEWSTKDFANFALRRAGSDGASCRCLG